MVRVLEDFGFKAPGTNFLKGNKKGLGGEEERVSE